MIASKHLSELLNFKAPTPSIVSVYLEIDGNRAFTGALRQLLKAAGGGDDALSPLHEDFKRIERFVETEFDPAAFRGLAVFSSKRFGLWRVCPLPQPVKTKLQIAERPFLAPLLSMTDQHHRFGVVLAGPGRASFLEVFMGQIKEYEEMAVCGETIEEHEFLKDISRKLDGLARNQGFQRIIVGVTPELSLKLVNHLHSSLQHNLILDTELEPEMTAAAILERILACEDQARQVRETVLVHRLLDAVKGGARLGVLGLDRTLDALQKGQVRLLLVRDGYAKMGRCCPECGKLSLAWTKCLDCGRATETVFNLVAEMIDRALASGCEVFRLFHDTPLDNLGKIGAELTCNPPETAVIPAAAVRLKAGSTV